MRLYCLLVSTKENLSCVFFFIDIVTDDRLPEKRRTETWVGLVVFVI